VEARVKAVVEASDKPRGESGTSIHPVKVSRCPGCPPFQIESPWRHRIRVWLVVLVVCEVEEGGGVL